MCYCPKNKSYWGCQQKSQAVCKSNFMGNIDVFLKYKKKDLEKKN